MKKLIKYFQLRWEDKQNEICRQEYNDLFILCIFFCPLAVPEALPLSLSVCLSLPVSRCLPLCVSACLSEQQSTPWHPQSAFKFYATLPPAQSVCGPTCCDLHQPTIKTQFYRGCYCTAKREHKLSITYLLLLDKGGHVNRGNGAV